MNDFRLNFYQQYNLVVVEKMKYLFKLTRLTLCSTTVDYYSMPNGIK